jgi:hypothetical protein
MENNVNELIKHDGFYKLSKTIPTINRVFNDNPNITINTLNNLINGLGLRYSINFNSF